MDQVTKNRLKLIFIAGMFALPVISAWLIFNNPQWLEGGETKNYGELIKPVITSDLTEYVLDGDEKDLSALKGRWVLLHIDTDAQCLELCEKTVHLIHQLHVLLNKDAKRLKRVYLNKSLADITPFLSQAPDLYMFHWNDQLLEELKSKVGDLADDDVLLMDPLGNIMMKYSKDADPYGIQKDLKHLFKASQIG
jgi:hypothetical protein